MAVPRAARRTVGEPSSASISSRRKRNSGVSFRVSRSADLCVWLSGTGVSCSAAGFWVTRFSFVRLRVVVSFLPIAKDKSKADANPRAATFCCFRLPGGEPRCGNSTRHSAPAHLQRANLVACAAGTRYADPANCQPVFPRSSGVTMTSTTEFDRRTPVRSGANKDRDTGTAETDENYDLVSVFYHCL